MKDARVQGAARGFLREDLTYVVNVRVFADFDGVLVEPEEGIDPQLRQILDEIQEADPGSWKRTSTKNSLFFCARAAGTDSWSRTAIPGRSLSGATRARVPSLNVS